MQTSHPVASEGMKNSCSRLKMRSLFKNGSKIGGNNAMNSGLVPSMIMNEGEIRTRTPYLDFHNLNI